MDKKLRVGIIGTGTMALRHIGAFQSDPRVELRAVCDQNLERAQGVARQYGIPSCFGDYRELLKDESIDAVTVVTPTFTHAAIVLDALKAGKHVMCEKPPALTVRDAQACVDAAKAAGRLLMYGFVYRFNQNIRFLKDYIASGAMGDIYAVDVFRLQRCSQLGGWFVDKSKSGGGQLMDAAIHQVDAVLYLMGMPAIKTVKGYTSYVNSDLPEKTRGLGGGYASADNGQAVNRTVESLASGFVTFENNAYLYVKAGLILNTVEEGSRIDLHGTRAGARITSAGVELVKPDESGYFLTSAPVLKEKVDAIRDELVHFVDCCLDGIPCVNGAESGLPVMRLISAIYESAETGREIRFS